MFRKIVIMLFFIMPPLQPPLVAGVLTIPSPFVLQRPLNPALISGSQAQGLAVSTILRPLEEDCVSEAYDDCRMTGLGGLFYMTHNALYFQFETLNQESNDESTQGETTLKNERKHQQYLAMLAGTWKYLSLGFMLKQSYLKVRKRLKTPTKNLPSGGDEEELFLSIGGLIHWKDYYVSLYNDWSLTQHTEDVNGRQVDEEVSPGFLGLGFGGTSDSSGDWSYSWELAQLIKRENNKEMLLTEMAGDLTWKSWTIYGVVVVDLNDNHFEGNTAEDVLYRPQIASGIAFYGDSIQIQLGRDPRFFRGLDGGIQLTMGFQFPFDL